MNYINFTILIFLSLCIPLCVLIIYFYLKKRDLKQYYTDKSQKYIFINNKKRKKYLKKLIPMLTFIEYINLITRDKYFYFFLEHFNLDKICSSEKLDNPEKHCHKEEEINFDEIEFKKALCSQNILLKKKAAAQSESFLYLEAFLQERFQKESDEEVLELLINRVGKILSVSSLMNKLKKTTSDSLASSILFKLKDKKSNLKKEERAIDSIEYSEYRVLCQAILYPDKFVENLINIVEKNSNTQIVGFGLSLLGDITIDDTKKLSRIIRVIEKYQNSTEKSTKKEKKNRIEKSVYSIGIKKTYNLLNKFHLFDDFCKMILTNRVLRFDQELITGAFLTAVSKSRDSTFVPLLKELVKDTDSVYVAVRALEALCNMDEKIEYYFISRFKHVRYEEIDYYLLQLLSRNRYICKKSTVLFEKILKKSDRAFKVFK
ncbi:MAG: hypothetical protein ACQESP_01845 [Candidatus Muiribacteriota bacterium]